MERPKAENTATQNHVQRYSTIPLPILGPPLASVRARDPVVLLTPPLPVPRPAPSGTIGTQQFPQAAANYRAVLKPHVPWWDRERMILRSLATLGGLLTVIGAFFFVMNFPEFFALEPPTRVILGTILGFVLLGVSAWLHRRRMHPVAICGMLGTSAAVLCITLLVSAFTYGWLSEWVTLALFAALTVAYLGIGRAWRHESYVILVGSVSLISTVVIGSLLDDAVFLSAFTGLALLALVRGTHWQHARIAGGSFVLIGVAIGDTLQGRLMGSDIRVEGLPQAIALAILVGIVFFDQKISRQTFQFVGLFVNSMVLFFGAEATSTGWIAWILVGITFGWAMVAYLRQSDVTQWSETLALTWLPLCFVGVVLNTPSTSVLQSHMVPWVFLLVFAAAIAWISEQREHWVVWASWSLVSLYMVSPMHSSVMLKRPLWLTSTNSVTIAFLLFVVLSVALWHRKSLTALPNIVAFLLALLGLHYSTLAVVTTATFIGAALAGDPTMWLGYLVGHALISISWIFASGWILLGHSKLPQRASLGVGITLAIAGTLKLVFLDMSTLTGLPRIAAFLISGIILLIIATRRSKHFTHNDSNQRHAYPPPQYPQGQYPPPQYPQAQQPPAGGAPTYPGQGVQ